MDAERALRRLRDAYGAGDVSTATLEVRTALALTGQGRGCGVGPAALAPDA